MNPNLMLDETMPVAPVPAKPKKAKRRTPSLATMERWVANGVAKAACREGCEVEPDGHCAHGKPSWLLVLGMI